jgi:hypothetical protein
VFARRMNLHDPTEFLEFKNMAKRPDEQAIPPSNLKIQFTFVISCIENVVNGNFWLVALVAAGTPNRPTPRIKRPENWNRHVCLAPSRRSFMRVGTRLGKTNNTVCLFS